MNILLKLHIATDKSILLHYVRTLKINKKKIAKKDIQPMRQTKNKNYFTQKNHQKHNIIAITHTIN